MKKHELIQTLASTLASKDDVAQQEIHSTYISTVITFFATLERLGFEVVPSKEEETDYKSEAMLETIFKNWCETFEVTPNWPDEISLEEKLDRYFFPQLHEYLGRIETDREYYQNRLYVMQWAFRKLLKTYREISKEFEYANIHFLADDLLWDVTEGESPAGKDFGSSK